MTRILLDLLLFSLALGFVEALYKPAMRQLTRNKVQRWAPKALEVIDPLLPVWLQMGVSGKEMEAKVQAFLEGMTGESWSQPELDELFQTLDVRVTADQVSQMGATTASEEPPASVLDTSTTG